MRPVTIALFERFRPPCACIPGTSNALWPPLLELREGLGSSGSKSIGTCWILARAGLTVIQMRLAFVPARFSKFLWADPLSLVVLFLLVPCAGVWGLTSRSFSLALIIISLITLASRASGRNGKYAWANGCIRSWLFLVTAASCQLLCAILGPKLSPNTS